MADIKWIKVATDMFDDRKIKQIACMPKGESIIIIWIKLLCLAGDINDRGRIYFVSGTPYTEQMLATQFGTTPQMIRLALGTLERFAMISVGDDCMTIVNWEKHQNVDGMEKLREQAKKRMADMRGRRKGQAKNVTSDADVTQDVTRDVTQALRNSYVTSDADVTQCYATEEEEEKEKENSFTHSLSLCARKSEKTDGDGESVEKPVEKSDPELAYSQRAALGGIGGGVVLLSDEQIEKLLDQLSLDEFNHYCEVVRDCELAGKKFRNKTHYQAILDMAKADRRS